MKYCKKCFHNVREDVDVCPYCDAISGNTAIDNGNTHSSTKKKAKKDKSTAHKSPPITLKGLWEVHKTLNTICGILILIFYLILDYISKHP